VENQTWKKVKCLRTNNGTEYANDEFKYFCEQHGRKRHFTIRKTPNGVAVRMNRSIVKRARCLRLNAGLAKIFLGRYSEYGMLLDQQVSEGSTRWESCRGGVDM
jgi:hypothetical protein